ncbi:MAG: hypothetical protein AseanaTS_15870 [Candidatus Pelagadaptatus aseana]
MCGDCDINVDQDRQNTEDKVSNWVNIGPVSQFKYYVNDKWKKERFQQCAAIVINTVGSACDCLACIHVRTFPFVTIYFLYCRTISDNAGFDKI